MSINGTESLPISIHSHPDFIRHAHTKHAPARHDVGISNPAFSASSEKLQIFDAGNFITSAQVLSITLTVTFDSGVVIANFN